MFFITELTEVIEKIMNMEKIREKHFRHSGNFDEVVIIRNPVVFAWHGDFLRHF